MSQRNEGRWRKQCQALYQSKAKEMYASWIQQANDLATQDKPNWDEYCKLKEIVFKTTADWENLYAPCGYWPQEMRDDSFKLYCALQKIWNKITDNINK